MNDKTFEEDITNALQEVKEGVNSLEEKLSGTLNDPNETDVLMKVGKIDDGSKYKRKVCVLQHMGQDGKQYYAIYEFGGFISLTDEKLKKDYKIDGNINLDGKDYSLWGYEKTGESQKGKYDFISLSLAVKKETDENGTPF